VATLWPQCLQTYAKMWSKWKVFSSPQEYSLGTQKAAWAIAHYQMHRMESSPRRRSIPQPEYRSYGATRFGPAGQLRP
jgi:hypothetical protein